MISLIQLKTMDKSSSDAITTTSEIQDFSTELVSHPQIAEYIAKLEEKLKHQQNIIKDLNEKIKNYENHNESSKNELTDNSTQTDFIKSQEKTSQGWVTDDKNETKSILEQVTQVAESAVLQTGFVYQQDSGLYYHYDTGYYYDPNSKLYYNGSTKTYYYYDEDSKSYKFYSQVPEEKNKKVKKKKKYKRKTKKAKLSATEKSESDSEKKKCSDNDTEEEEGQLLSTSSEDGSNEETVSSLSSSDYETEKVEDVAKTYPPCMRLIVKETNLSKLKTGYLFIVTFIGGSIGREGDHSIVIPDINVSKHHARLQYNDAKKVYEIIDLGSRNGTLLNGTRLSVAKKESDPSEILHGSILQLGQTKLLCHVHNGHDTCGHCEPGLLQLESVIEQNHVSLKSQYQEELKRLKSKFGVEGDNTMIASSLAAGYQDRAQSRRVNVGSSNQYDKTQQSSLNELISKDNMGFKMLVKMGWKEGKSLGKNGIGITEPVPLQPSDSAELNANDKIYKAHVDPNAKKKQAIWRKTQQRFNDVSK